MSDDNKDNPKDPRLLLLIAHALSEYERKHGKEKLLKLLELCPYIKKEALDQEKKK